MKLKRLFTALSVNTDMLSSAAASSSSSLMSGEHTPKGEKKLKMKELKELTPEARRKYLMK